MIRKVEVLVIDRAKWGVGRNGGALRRYNEELYCCLGLYGLALGADKKAIQGSTFLGDSHFKGNVMPNEARWLTSSFCSNSEEARALAKVNDSKTCTQKWREKEVKRRFGKQGIEVKFIGRMPKQPNVHTKRKDHAG